MDQATWSLAEKVKALSAGAAAALLGLGAFSRHAEWRSAGCRARDRQDRSRFGQVGSLQRSDLPVDKW